MDAEAKEIIAKKRNFFGKPLLESVRLLSREPIVFVKGVGNENMIKWTVVVGEAFADFSNNKVFIPIRIVG